jgi:prophage DNA circulation protein
MGELVFEMEANFTPVKVSANEVKALVEKTNAHMVQSLLKMSNAITQNMEKSNAAMMKMLDQISAAISIMMQLCAAGFSALITQIGAVAAKINELAQSITGLSSNMQTSSKSESFFAGTTDDVINLTAFISQFAKQTIQISFIYDSYKG